MNDDDYCEYGCMPMDHGEPDPDETSSRITFAFPDVHGDGAQQIGPLALEAAGVLRASGVAGPFSVTVTVEGYWPETEAVHETDEDLAEARLAALRHLG